MFIFFSQSTVHRGMITSLPVWWRHFLCDLASLHAFITTRPYIFPVSWWCLGSAAAIGGSIQTYDTVSFVATYQHGPHLFNSDLEGEAGGGARDTVPFILGLLNKRDHGDQPPRDTWIIADKAHPPAVLPPWIIYPCKGLDQLVNLSNAALN